MEGLFHPTVVLKTSYPMTDDSAFLNRDRTQDLDVMTIIDIG